MSDAPDDTSLSPIRRTDRLSSPAARGCAYTIALTVAAAAIIFTNLGGPRIEGDEGHYALCTDTIRQTGKWLTLMPHPPKAYFSKPPLYMWLSAATYNVVPGFAEKYRFWAAAFGVGCIAITCVLGWLLFSPEVGALAGALLLSNRQFLLEHGARAGDMDTGLTLLMGVSLVLLWLIVSARVGWWGWAGIGIAAGLASLFKPFFGVPILVTVLILAAALTPRARLRAWLEGPLVALLLMAVVAAPWYVIQWVRFRGEFVNAILHNQVVKRLTTGLNPGETQGPWFYLWGDASISGSSPAFALFLPALLFVAVAAFLRQTRWRQYALLACVGIGWVTSLSLSKGKFLHYAYPAFPVLAVAIAVMSLDVLRLCLARVRNAALARRLHGCAITAASIAFVVIFCRLAYHVMPQQQKRFVPWETYQAFRPAIEDGRMRFVLFGVPAEPAEWEAVEPAVQSTDMFYLWHMRGAVRAATPEELSLLLEHPRPTLALLSRTRDWADVYDRRRLGARIDERFTFEHRVFTVATIDVDSLLHPRLTAGTPSPYIELIDVGPPDATAGGGAGAATRPSGWGFRGGFTVRVRPPLPQDVRVNVVVRRSLPTRSMRVRRTTIVDKIPFAEPLPTAFAEGLRLSAVIEHDRRNPSRQRSVSFRLAPSDQPFMDETIEGTITDAWIDVLLPLTGGADRRSRR